MLTKDKAFYRTIFAIALPAAFQSLISLLTNLADNIMVAYLGDTALAGVSQANSVTLLFNMTMFGLVSGSTVLISQYWGKRDSEPIKRIFSIVAWIAMAAAVLVVCLIRLWPAQILRLVTDDPAVIKTATVYFSLVCFSYLPFALSAAFTGMLRAVEVVRVALWTAILSLAVNVSLNYVLIFGRLGFPALGLRGAAIATIAARCAELLVVWIYTFHVQKTLKVSPRLLLQKPDLNLLKDYARYGLPVGLTDLQWAFIGVLKASIIGRLGATAMAANSIGNSMMDLGTLFTNALAQGACVLIGKTVGAKDYAKTREYAKTVQILFFCFGFVVSGCVFLLRGPYASLYGSSEEVLALAREMIALGAVTLIGTTYHASCFTGINRGAGDNRFVMFVDMICGWLIVLPISFLAAFVWKVDLKWMFLFLRIDQCFKWIIAFLRLRGNKWIKNVTRDS